MKHSKNKQANDFDESNAEELSHAGCIPVMTMDRRRPNTPDNLSILQVTKHRPAKEDYTESGNIARQWVFPKGHIEKGEDSEATALRETWEEAGVNGTIISDWSTVTHRALAPYEDEDDDIQVIKWYMLNVTSISERYPEAESRQRRWIPLENASTHHDVTKQTRQLTRQVHTHFNKEANCSSTHAWAVSLLPLILLMGLFRRY